MRIFTLVFGLLAALVACAQESTPIKPIYVEGEHYQVLAEPVPTLTKSKIEVSEVFWYGCGHCFQFEPIINAWEKTLQADVELVKLPAIWNKNMEIHAKMFYTAKALQLEPNASEKIFAAMHKDGKKLVKRAEIAALFGEMGVEEAKFSKVFDSFGVKSQAQQAGSRARNFKVTGTPEVIVNGRYRISTRMKGVGGHEKMLEVTDYLIQKARKSKK